MIPYHANAPVEDLREQLRRSYVRQQRCLSGHHHYVWNNPQVAGEACLRCEWCGEYPGAGVTKWKETKP